MTYVNKKWQQYQPMAQIKAFVIKSKCLNENFTNVENIFHYYFERKNMFFK
jgi:hypothetical protein